MSEQRLGALCATDLSKLADQVGLGSTQHSVVLIASRQGDHQRVHFDRAVACGCEAMAAKILATEGHLVRCQVLGDGVADIVWNRHRVECSEVCKQMLRLVAEMSESRLNRRRHVWRMILHQPFASGFHNLACMIECLMRPGTDIRQC